MTAREDLIRLIEGSLAGVPYEMASDADIAETVMIDLQQEADTSNAGWLIFPTGVFRIAPGETVEVTWPPLPDGKRMFAITVQGPQEGEQTV